MAAAGPARPKATGRCGVAGKARLQARRMRVTTRAVEGEPSVGRRKVQGGLQVVGRREAGEKEDGFCPSRMRKRALSFSTVRTRVRGGSAQP